MPGTWDDAATTWDDALALWDDTGESDDEAVRYDFFSPLPVRENRIVQVSGASRTVIHSADAALAHVGLRTFPVAVSGTVCADRCMATLSARATASGGSAVTISEQAVPRLAVGAVALTDAVRQRNAIIAAQWALSSGGRRFHSRTYPVR